MALSRDTQREGKKPLLQLATCLRASYENNLALADRCV
eukprot:CAMPEP_0169152854 /NCGR_PEP_ID=MMETSP1015-20121227/51753_1 /TAXON_ID=342587 /ORGANISM="Karlodinium micrum, Strain CCMP2283" /LENGTH=37 /DNA_ID= /DNA_START= /DNA_END= /DNA_ORIENTATION=